MTNPGAAAPAGLGASDTLRPLPDVRAEAHRVVAATDAGGVRARVLGGVAVAIHDHVALPSSLIRPYADIDLVVEKGGEGGLARVLTGLGYEADRKFNALYGYRRMLFWDRPNDRQLDVFVGRFAMCHALDLGGRLASGPTLTPADLLLTKLQIVELNPKDIVDALALIVSHELADESAGDVLGQDRIGAVTGSDWGWFTTASDSLARIRERADVAGELAEAARARIDAILATLDAAPKSFRWRARARVGRRMPWYELPEEHVR
jgi:hypothetical protein